ncbi:MAG TPA: heavy-metal-associated domain-containing protein [Bacteroidetes bacterium]|nr:heavy-metal-associated domain-containing protein [Bacteroidota bacterium]
MKNSIKKLLAFTVSVIIFTAFSSISANAQNQAQTDNERVFIKIEIKGLACPYCAYGMERELKKVSGVEDVDIELKTGMAYISTPISQKPSKEELTKIVDDGGFTAGGIEYSDRPFEIKKKKKKRS